MPTFSIAELTGSTNSDLLNDLASGAIVPEGHWHVARTQRGGRGRHGRVWIGKAGNYHGSTSVIARADDPPPVTLALVAAIAVYTALKSLISNEVAPQLVIKWPNDMMVGPAKIAGILLERSHDVTIVGVGVNLANAPAHSGRETIALTDVGNAISLEEFTQILADHFATELCNWRTTGLAYTLSKWESCATPRGTALTITNGSHAGLTGAFDGLDRDGNLQLATDNDQVLIVRSGEVILGDMQPIGIGAAFRQEIRHAVGD